MLNSKTIKELIKNKQLITDYIDLNFQIQPCGFDLSLKEVRVVKGEGRVDFNNEEREISETNLLCPDKSGWYHLQKGCYIVIYNEAVKIPKDIVAIARPRSTVLRNAATVETAVWDPGYEGRSSSLLIIHNPYGLKLKKQARIAQLVFFTIEEVEKGYQGIYQKEGI